MTAEAGAGAGVEGAKAGAAEFRVRYAGGAVEVRGARWEAMAVGALELLRGRIVEAVAGEPGLTAKGAREMAEEFYGLPRGALFPHRAAIRSKLDALLGVDAEALEAERALVEEEKAEAEAQARIRKEAEAQRGRRREASRAVRAREQGAVAQEKVMSRVKPEPADGAKARGVAGGAAATSKQPDSQERLKKLLSIAKWARIQYPVGRRRDVDTAAALLQKYGLCENSSKRDIKAVRARLQQERDLEGIDTQNILEGRRAPQAAAGVAAMNPYAADKPKTESEAERAPLRDHGLPAEAAPVAMPGGKGVKPSRGDGKENEAEVPSAVAARVPTAIGDWDDDDF